MGQNLLTGTRVAEINFAMIIAVLGLVLFALLIGNMQVSLAVTSLLMCYKSRDLIIICKSKLIVCWYDSNL